MKLHILSDLHREFLRSWSRPAADPAYRLGATDAEVVVLAGDIDVGTAGLAWAIEEAARLAKPIVYVLGNHELYAQDTGLIDDLRARARGTGVHVLECDELVLGGVRFLGCALWTDFKVYRARLQAAALEEAGARLNDYRQIRHPDGRLVTPHDTLAWHAQSRAWLERSLATPFAGPTVVITHTGPLPRSAHPHYGMTLLSGAFLSNLESLMGSERVALWVHGHTHACVDYTLRGTRVIANPRGYPGLEAGAGFDPACVVEV